MRKKNRGTLYKTIELLTPSFIKACVKKVYYKILRFYNRCAYIKKGRFVEFGHRFRFDYSKPYRVYIGERTITEDYNVWNAQLGNIIVGKKCWFGLNNVLMGPVEIGDNLQTGPYVKILGPRHAAFGYDKVEEKKTIIGNNVWISTGSIILSGVKIGDNAIVGAGSVVNKDVPDNAFVNGNPARNFSAMAHRAWGVTEDKAKEQNV